MPSILMLNRVENAKKNLNGSKNISSLNPKEEKKNFKWNDYMISMLDGTAISVYFSSLHSLSPSIYETYILYVYGLL